MTASRRAAPDCTDVPTVVAKPAVAVIELMAALGREIEPHEGTHQIFNATGKGRVGVEDFAGLVFGKYAGAHHVFAALERYRVVIEFCRASDQVLPFE